MGAPIRARALAILAAVVLATACSAAPDTTPAEDSEPITFPAEDGVTLAGRLFGPEEARSGVVLAHMFPADQRSWFAFADRLAGRGYRVLTFDFRGYCPGGDGGCSEGEREIDQLWRDVVGAVAAIRDQGVTDVGLIGASMGGTASLLAAGAEGVDVDAVITLSAPVSFQGLAVSPEALSRITAAKLFLAGLSDPAAAQALDALFAASVQPKRSVVLTTGDHGTDILSGNQGSGATNEILAWLDRYVGTG